MATLESIPLKDLKIDPSVEKQEKYVQALLGDKILGSAAATALLKQVSSSSGTNGDTSTTNTTTNTGHLTKRISAAVSNAFLAQHAPHIFPAQHYSLITSNNTNNNLSDWEIGTAVEAAVCAVHAVNPDAVAQLAEYLVTQQGTQRSDPNTKGRLLELGGTVTSQRTGGGDHNPVFEAVAQLDDATATAKGPNKRRAEMLAAARVLQAATGEPLLEEEQLLVPSDSAIPRTHDQWEVFENIQGIDDMLTDESVVDWWKRGATAPAHAFHRAMMAPAVFPKHITAVDSWVRRTTTNNNEVAAVFLVIVEQRDNNDDQLLYYHTIPVQTAESATRARQVVGRHANRAIADIVGLELVEDSDDDEH